MARPTHFDEYRDRYPDYAFERTDDGILVVRMHRDGGPAVWDHRTHHDIGSVFNDIAGDRGVRVVIFTGTGENFNANWGRHGDDLPASIPATAEQVEEMGWYGRLRHDNMLAIDAIMIAAVNGPTNIHAELPFMCDVVLCSDDAYFQDAAHFPRNLSPGDGVHTIMPMIIGRNRFRYWQLTGQKMTAQMAYEWGAVNEVLPKDQVLDRAWEIARHLTKYSPVVLRHTRRTFVQEFKRAAVNDLAFGQSMELLGMTQFRGSGGGMKPLDRAWDDPELWKES